MKFIFKLLFIILLLFNFTLMYLLNKKQNTKIVNKSSENGLNVLIENLIKENESSFSFEGEKVNGNSYLIDTLKIIVDRPMLVFKYSEEACQICVDLALLDLKNLKKFVDDKDILIITSYNNENYFKAFKSSLNPEYSFLNITDDSEIQTYDIFKKTTAPHFFILNENLIVNSSYFYQKEIPQLSKVYFNEIKNKFKK